MKREKEKKWTKERRQKVALKKEKWSKAEQRKPEGMTESRFRMGRNNLGWTL